MTASSSPESIFFAALEKTDPAERAAYLDQACRGDDDLRRRVERLLKAHPQVGSFLDQPVADKLAGEAIASGEGTARAGAQPVHDQLNETRSEAHGASAAADVPDFLAPSQKPGSLARVGHYEILEVVGRGGMGVVLKAFDEKLRRVVAIKVMAPELAASGEARKRFTREAQAAAAVNHEHVVAIHAVEESHQPPYLVMQFIDGISLQNKLNRDGPPALKDILRIALQTAEGLAAAHRQGLVHRDIKPANILLENGVARVKITDFGLARPVDDGSLTQPGLIPGTPAYMSPEQAAGEPIDHRSDLFSLGSMLYALCTGRPPFRASGSHAVLKRVIEDTPRPIPEVNPEIPGWLCDLIARLHAKNPADRFQSAKEVADLLGQYLAHVRQPGQAALSKSVEQPRPLPPVRKRHWAGWVAACILVLGLCAGLFLGYQAGWFSGSPDSRGTVHPDPVGDPDRRAAEYVLAIGGKVQVNDEDVEIRVAAALPPGAFRLTAAGLWGNKQVSDSGLAHFKGCTNLRWLNLWFTPVGDAGLAHLKDCKNLADLSLDETKVGDVGLAHLQGCKKLTVLGLGGTQVTDVGLAYFQGCKGLKKLRLSNTQVTNAGLAHLKDCKKLVYLDLDNTSVSAAGLTHLKDCKKLTVLGLSGTQVNDAGLAHFQGCKDLTELYLNNTQVTNVGLAHFKDCKNLTLLDLAETQVTDAGLVHFKDCKDLTELNLWGTSVGDPGLDHFKDCKNLTKLTLGHTKVGDAGMANFKDCKSLLVLGLAETQVTDAGLVHFKDCKDLEYVNVENTRVGDKGLAHLKDCKNLTSINLHNTSVSDVGLAHFQGCKDLEELRLNNTQVTDDGLTPFLDCKKLTLLKVKQTKVTAAKIDELRKALPQCRIEWDGGVIEPSGATK
jgi:serine/threonine protein kinase/Leucine-rich repeat (LRR) protein